MSAPPSAPSVSSRFVSSKELEAASQKRQEEWKAAYERIGQEPPKQDEGEGTYDPRSLWEKLQENKVSYITISLVLVLVLDCEREGVSLESGERKANEGKGT